MLIFKYVGKGGLRLTYSSKQELNKGGDIHHLTIKQTSMSKILDLIDRKCNWRGV